MIIKKRTLITLDTSLRDIPEAWLKFIEPRLTRPANTTCWLWEAGVDSNGEPILNVLNPDTGKRTTKRLKRFIAEEFWEMKSHYEVIHECGVMNCLNPAHFYITATHWSQENRAKRIALKRRGIIDYINRK